MDTKRIGRSIAEKRKEKGYTQEQLGNILGVSNKTISRWENGNYMPDLSLLIPLSEALDITLNELLTGEKIEEEKIIEVTEENLKNTIGYTQEKLDTEYKKTSLVMMLVGLLLCYASFTMIDSISIAASICSIIGISVFVSGLYRMLKSHKKIISTSVFVIILVSFLLFDYVGVVSTNRPPMYRYKTHHSDIVTYYSPFYKVYQINANTKNEYYLVDTKHKYTEETVPRSIFNRSISGYNNIKKHKNTYIGNNSNIGNLLNNLPLNEFGYVFKIDSKNLGLTINYNTTDRYNDNMYIEKSLIYNSVSIFSLIDNVQTIQYNFSGSSYTVTRKMIKESYPHFELVKENEKNFDQYLENKMNDDEFSRSIFNKIFVKNVL